MKKVNALRVRQALGAVLDDMDAMGEPVLVEKDRRPRAVLIPLKMFLERFVDKTAHDERLALEGWFENIETRAGAGHRRGQDGSVEAIRALRGALP